MSIPVGKYMSAWPLGFIPNEVYAIRDRVGDVIGMVEWYPTAGHGFKPESNVVLSHDCCAELAKFLDSCNRATKVLEGKS